MRPYYARSRYATYPGQLRPILHDKPASITDLEAGREEGEVPLRRCKHGTTSHTPTQAEEERRKQDGLMDYADHFTRRQYSPIVSDPHVVALVIPHTRSYSPSRLSLFLTCYVAYRDGCLDRCGCPAVLQEGLSKNAIPLDIGQSSAREAWLIRARLWVDGLAG